MSMTQLSICLILILAQQAICQFTTIAVVATNDIHGSAFPIRMRRLDNNETYSYGGLAYMGGLIQIIKDEYPDHTLFLDAGDQFQGAIESSPLISSGKIINDFYSALELNASAIGNHDFDNGPAFLSPFLASKSGQNLAANIRSEKGESQFLANQKISHLYAFKSGIKIGVIGLSTIYSAHTSTGFTSGKFPAYKFLDYKDIVISESKHLKKSGANAVLVLGHLGNNCNTTNTNGNWTVDTKQDQCIDDQASKLIESLPNGTIDGLIQGHRHKFAHHFKNEVPYLGTINGGFYFNVLYLKFHKTTLYDKMIEGPIPVCQKIFQNLGTCDYIQQDRLKVAGRLVNWRFHNKDVRAHQKVKAIFDQQWLPKLKPYMNKVVQSQVYLQVVTDRQSELGNLITTLIHDCVPNSDLVIIHPGSLRSIWVPGQIQYYEFYNMLPIDYKLVSFDITGQEIINVLQIIQAGESSFYQTYGLQQTVVIESNGQRKLTSVTLAGQSIVLDKIYRCISLDYLLQGGQEFYEIVGKKFTPKNQKIQGQIKSLLLPKLLQLQIIRAGSLIDPDNPRIIIERKQ